jgi:hypothetical protein
MTFAWHCLCGTLNLDGLDQVGDASLESEQERRHGMTGPEWRVATALFTAGEVTTSICIFNQSMQLPADWRTHGVSMASRPSTSGS